MAKKIPQLAPINFVTGTLGSGKSYIGMRYIFHYLVGNKPIAANFDLVGNWWETVADLRRSSIWDRLDRWDKKERGLQAAGDRYREMGEIRKLAYRFDVQDDLYDFDLPGEGEDRGLLVLDEQALTMNARNWEDRKRRETAQYGNNMKSLQFYINMRKLGWSALVLAHSHEQLDSQLRMMGGAVLRCRNLAKVTIPMTSIRMFKKPRFIVLHIWPETKPVHVFKKEVYGLNLRIANHYQSMQTFDATPEKLGMRFQAPPLQKVAYYPAQPRYTFDLGARKRLRERLGTTVEDLAGAPALGGPHNASSKGSGV